MAGPGKPFDPYLVAVNLTERCNLSCPHCYLDAGERAAGGGEELGEAELAALFTQIGARAPGTLIVLTGGEPLLRRDLEGIVAAGVAAGLRMVLGTNGVRLEAPAVGLLASLGLAGVGVSLDSVDPGRHDAFRGAPGSFARSCAAIRRCRLHGLPVQVHFTVTRHNHGELERMVDLARELGAGMLNVFFLVCVGRGQPALDLPPRLYEATLRRIVALHKRHAGLMVNARCAPHVKRLLYEDDPASPFTRATGYDGGGCLAATHYCRITPRGEVTPCPYIERSAGNLRTRPFWEIWDGSPLFDALRDSRREGRCGTCEFRRLCGGCRARSLGATGSLIGEDPSCLYTPRGGGTIPVLTAADAPGPPVVWTPEAEEHLRKVPRFVRNMVKRRLEDRARAGGVPVTVELMQAYRKERERELGFRFR